MPITPTNNEVVFPPVEQKTADKYWITNLEIYSPNVGGGARIICRLVPYNSTTGESFQTETRILTINDIFPIAMQDQEVAATIEMLFAQIDKLGKQQGVI